MQTYLVLGNLFSLLSAICIAVSVIKKNKNDLIYWQIIDVIFCILSNIALYTYAALTTNSVALLRNILAYKNKLTKKNNLDYARLMYYCRFVGKQPRNNRFFSHNCLRQLHNLYVYDKK